MTDESVCPGGGLVAGAGGKVFVYVQLAAVGLDLRRGDGRACEGIRAAEQIGGIVRSVPH